MKLFAIKNSFFSAIVSVMFVAAIAYLVCSLFFSNHIIQYATLPPKVSIAVFDELKKDTTYFDLAVISKLKIDSLQHVAKPGGAFTIPEMLYHQNPIFLVWIMLVLIMISIAAGSVPFFISQMIRLKQKFKINKKEVWKSSFYTLIMLFFLYLSSRNLPGFYKPPLIINNFHILLSDGAIVKGVVGITIILLIPALMNIFLVGACADRITILKINAGEIQQAKMEDPGMNDKFSEEIKRSLEEAAVKFEQLNQALRTTLQILAVIVVFSVLTSSALRESIKAVVEIKFYDIFPTEVSYVYGLYFSLFLCIMYVPVYFYLKGKYIELKENILKVEKLQIVKEDKWFQSVSGIAKFDGSPLDNFRLALTVLSPLISSFLPDTLHIFK